MILVGLGSNLSFNGKPPAGIITSAFVALNKIVTVAAVSRLYWSPAWPDPDDPPFVNAVARIETPLAPAPLLAALHALEAGFGRRRGRANAPRTLDLDLLDYDGIRFGGGAGQPALPHPRLTARDFVLAPLAEVAPGWRYSATGQTAAELLGALSGRTARPLAAAGPAG
ncbi:MAG: 2-amino-4-hydroxy-6-hydroxymethyldihydropteridine diphosphokinase [Alphaproteobacteria bacterium]|nr:2-amino-4-hydroxy-6-hydroxymethyldihydropteridine diphosphokinase [Alphaproteobacteria bacterium]